MLKHGAAARQRGQWSLIGTLVAVAILIILAAVYLPRILRPQGSSSPDQSTVIDRANGTACTLYLSQFTQAVMMYKQEHDGQPPRSMNDLKKYGITDDMINSPGCSFQMDPATGNVTNGPVAPSPAPSAAPAPGAPVIIGRPSSPAAPPPPNGGTRGPGGVSIPNIPTGGM